MSEYRDREAERLLEDQTIHAHAQERREDEERGKPVECILCSRVYPMREIFNGPDDICEECQGGEANADTRP